jgi:hypothetical protein
LAKIWAMPWRILLGITPRSHDRYKSGALIRTRLLQRAIHALLKSQRRASQPRSTPNHFLNPFSSILCAKEPFNGIFNPPARSSMRALLEMAMSIWSSVAYNLIFDLCHPWHILYSKSSV